MSEGDGDGCDAVLLLGLAFCCLIVMGFSLISFRGDSGIITELRKAAQ
jgi:hypothetical protein